MRLIFQPPCSTEYKICSSDICSTALPLLYSLDSYIKGVLGACIFLVIVSSIGENNGRFAILTIPSLCYACGLTFLVCIKTSFNSWRYIRSTESFILSGNCILCVALLSNALHFDDSPTKEDHTLKFTRRFTIWLCTYQLVIIVECIICLAIQWNHKWRQHIPDEALRQRRIAELHQTFKDIRLARYGGLTSVPGSESSHEVDDSCVYFPTNKLLVEESLNRPLTETNEPQLLPQFIRCSCCIDDLSSLYPVPSRHGNEENNDYFPPHLRNRSSIRSEFLTHPGWQHISPNSNERAPTAFKPHSLCNICLWICCSSRFVQSRDPFNPLRHFGLHIRERECFEHYPTPRELYASASNGCHLCTLIWTSLSPTQRVSLLAADIALQTRQERDLAKAQENHERRAIQKEYHCHRRVRVVIEPFDGDVAPVDSQVKSVHSLEPGKGSAQIIPHFGRYKRPRRWMCGIRDFKDHLLVEQGESEFAPPILILQSPPHISGPIMMPFSESTGSSYSMSLIKRWLHDTESVEAITFLPGRLLYIGSALKFGIVRVMGKEEIMVRMLAAGNRDGGLLMTDECEHKFALGCLDTSGPQCCACLAGDWETAPGQAHNHPTQFHYCPRCKEYWTKRSSREHGLSPAVISDDPRNLQYVALSHCWGEDPHFLTLTLDNQHSLRTGVSLAKLTKTFQESAMTAASVGYSFLWIDSLCIVQDSQEDWKRESVTMRDVYKNAAFTIVASASWSGKEGLFRAQNPLQNHPCVLGVRAAHEGKSTVTYAIPSQMDIEKTRRIELELCKWNRRGWCLQERALSRRVIFFGESQLHFELKEASGEVVHIQSQGNERDYFEPNRLRPEASVARGYFSQTWWEYVNSYTQRQLTYRSDRPLAIRGLAESMEEAGIPMFLSSLKPQLRSSGTASNDFIAGLLWYVDKDTTCRPSSEADNYPTWSWLSVDGVILNDSAGEVHENSTLSIKELVESKPVHDSNIMLAAGVKGLQLRGSGKLKRAKWKAVSHQFYFARRGGVNALCFNPPGYRDLELSIARHLQGDQHNRGNPRWWPRSDGRFEYLEMVKPITNDAEMGPRTHTLETEEALPVGWLVPDTTDTLQEDVYCLEIRVEPFTPAEKYKLTNTWAVRGLALERVGNDYDTGLPVYSRVGYFELDQKHNGFLHSDLAFDWRFPPAERKELRNNFLRQWPDVDPHGFFKGVVEQEFVIL
ncbi:heterokaryon incompatibility protein-domain-containing protein [Xylariaceae sp. AK1471]|nr:heterokaryon incompatibility protein-domain-containing protein [Xylariaceae sp. AK1471]